MSDYNLNAVRENKSDTALVFLHGFGGKRDETWGKFPLLVASDIPDIDIFTLGYATSLAPDVSGVWSADADLSLLAKRFTTILQGIPPISDYSELVIVAHSMGGLVAQKALVENSELAKRTRKFMCFGTPSSGLRKAWLLRFWKRSLNDMSIGSKFIESLRHDWNLRFGGGMPFDFRVVAGSQDEFVPYTSSLDPFPREYQWAIAGNHVSMIKPEDSRSEAVRALVAFLQDKGTDDEGNLLNQDIASLPPELRNDIVKCALFLDHRGQREESINLLESTKDLDTDAMGVLGGRYKRMWLENESDLNMGERALGLYEDALKLASAAEDAAQIYYHAINVAFLKFVFSGDRKGAEEHARIALEHARKSPKDIWSVATEAESHLYLGEKETALELYQTLPKLAEEPWQLSSALQQSFRVIAELEELQREGQAERALTAEKTLGDATVARGDESLVLEQVADGIANLTRSGGRLFISYAHEDVEWLDRLKTHLDGFTLNGDITFDFWDDKRIKAGQNWKQKIDQALDTCDVALCLVSGNFLGSKFIRDEELPQLLEAKLTRDVAFLWLHLSPSIWNRIEVGDRKPFEEIQAVWPPEPSLVELPEFKQEKALVETAITIVDSMRPS